VQILANSCISTSVATKTLPQYLWPYANFANGTVHISEMMHRTSPNLARFHMFFFITYHGVRVLVIKDEFLGYMINLELQCPED